MYSSEDIIRLLVLIGVGQAFVRLPSVARAAGWWARSFGRRTFFGLLVGWCAWAGAKSITQRTLVGQFVSVLRSGVIIDESGVLAKATEQAVVEAFVGLSREVVAATSNEVVQAEAEFARVSAVVTNSSRRLIYIASYLPRSGPGHINHNIAATCEKTSQTHGGSNIVAWVWFSQEPAFAPGMVAEFDVGGGPVRAVCVTNDFPATVAVNGVPCVRYEFCVPPGGVGVHYKPAYEVGFGLPDSPLIVPAGGISVKVGEVEYLPFSGTDSYFGGRVQVVYKGGLAQQCIIDGSAVTNGVYEL